MTPQSPRSCPTRGIPAFDPATPRPFTSNRVACPKPVFGVADPENVIRNAVKRAIAMLNNTIAQLMTARAAVCAGAWPVPLSAVASRWLKFCLSIPIDDVRAWTAGTFTNMSVAETIRRLIRVRNLLASNEIRYTCGSAPCCMDQGHCHDCGVGEWAWVCTFEDCEGLTAPEIVHLCRCFWLPSDKYGGKAGEKYDAATHAEFQAQTLIHETSHLTHCTDDFAPARRTIGGAECLSQFVAATNNSPIHPCFIKHCPCPGAPGMPSREELAKIDTFCNEHLACNPSAVAKRDFSPRPSRSRAIAAEMGNPPIHLADAMKFEDAVLEIHTQLKRNFLAGDEPGYLDRRRKLRIAFRSIPDQFADSLFFQLIDNKDPLAQLFHYKLHPATVHEMLGILFDKMKRIGQTL